MSEPNDRPEDHVPLWQTPKGDQPPREFQSSGGGGELGAEDADRAVTAQAVPTLRIDERQRALVADLARVEQALTGLREHVLDLSQSPSEQLQGSSAATIPPGDESEEASRGGDPKPSVTELKLELDALFGRMKSVEDALAVIQDELAHADIRGRTDELKNGLQFEINQALATNVADTKARIERRLHRARKSFNLTLGLFGLGVLAVVAASWWLGMRRDASNERRFDSLAAELEEARTVQVRVPAIEDMLVTMSEGLRRAEQRSDELAQALREEQPADRADAASPAQLGQISSVPEEADSVVSGAAIDPASEPLGEPVAQALSAAPASSSDESDQGFERSASAQSQVIDSTAALDGPTDLQPEQSRMVVSSASAGALTSAGPSTGELDAEVVPASAPASAPAASVAVAAAQGTVPNRAPLLLKEPRWMIQLIGFRSLNSALGFAENNNIAGYAWTRRVIYRSRPWFSVLIGDFPDEAAAMAAISRLSPGLRELQPIARQIKSGQRLEPTDRR